MNAVSIVMLIFALAGLVDRLIGNKFGIGKEFEKGFLLLGQLVLSMMGMIIIAPVLAELLSPVFDFVYDVLGIEPSIIPASLFANDMGGAPLAKEIAKNSQVGMYNAMVVSSMMGATVSFTIPLALGCLKKEKHRELILGLLSGIVTIPVGCIVAGFICKIPFVTLLLDLLPLIIFAVIIAVGLLLVPNVCIKIFNVLGALIKILVSLGLALGIIELLLGKDTLTNAIGKLPFNTEYVTGLIGRAAPASEGIAICLSAAVVMSGAFPLLYIVSKLLKKPMEAFGRALKINNDSTLGFLSTLANNVSTFEIMNGMDAKGTVLNSAFAVSASFILADHLAFTLSYEPSYLLPMMVAKITSGIAAVLFALVIYKKVGSKIAKGDS